MNELLFQKLIEAEGILVLQRLTEHRFRVVGVPPRWTEMLLQGELQSGQELDPAELFVFLDCFLSDAAGIWESGEDHALDSEPWTESLANREEFAFSATAVLLEGNPLLLVRRLCVDCDQRYKVFRKARELALAHELLLKETSEKEALVHCLVHDVAGPLQALTRCFELLGEERNLSEAGQKLVDLGGSTTHRQHGRVTEILDLLAAEPSATRYSNRDQATTPEVLDCAHSVLRSLRYSFETKGVSFELLLSPPANSNWKVIGQRDQLESVLYNLLDHALRLSPTGSIVTLRVEDEGNAIRVSVLDQGRKIELETAENHDSRVSRPDSAHDKGSLAMVYCRTMIERWSGEIGHAARPAGGNCFWFRLSKPETPVSGDFPR